MNMNADLNLNVTRRSEKDMPMTKTTTAGLRWLSLLIALARRPNRPVNDAAVTCTRHPPRIHSVSLRGL